MLLKSPGRTRIVRLRLDRLRLDRLLRLPAPSNAGGPPHVNTGPPETQVDDDETGTAGRRSEGLEASKQRKSIPFSVACNFQRAQVQLKVAEYSTKGDVAAGIQATPMGLRNDLARALLSNKKVDGPGMLIRDIWIPSVVHQWGKLLESSISLEV